MSEFSDLVQRVKASEGQNQDLYLGRLCWYSFSDVKVPHEDVVRTLVQEGISANLPLPPKNIDVFRRVSTACQVSRVATSDPDVFENYLLRELSGKSDNHITRRIVVEQVDRKGKRLAYDQIADIFFDRQSSVMTFSLLTANTNWAAAAQTIFDQIKHDYADWDGKLNTYSIREWTRHFIEGSLMGTKVRPGGGVYFVSEDHATEIEALSRFVGSVKGNCDFHSLPLVDDRKQREMLQRAFEAETSDAIDSLLVDIEGLKTAGKKITSDTYEKYVGQYQTLVERTQEYSNILEEKLTNSTSRLEIFQRSMMDLLSSVKAKKS